MRKREKSVVRDACFSSARLSTCSLFCSELRAGWSAGRGCILMDLELTFYTAHTQWVQCGCNTPTVCYFSAPAVLSTVYIGIAVYCEIKMRVFWSAVTPAAFVYIMLRSHCGTKKKSPHWDVTQPQRQTPGCEVAGLGTIKTPPGSFH